MISLFEKGLELLSNTLGHEIPLILCIGMTLFISYLYFESIKTFWKVFEEYKEDKYRLIHEYKEFYLKENHYLRSELNKLRKRTEK